MEKKMKAITCSTNTLYKGKVFDLVSEKITLTNGNTTHMDIIRHPGASAIIPMIDRHTVILLRQYRHAIGSDIWEIPAGTLEKNETPDACAKRELIEETGYLGTQWENLGKIIPVPGYSDEIIHVFLASHLLPAQQNLDTNEIIDVHKIKISSALEMIYNGEIYDGKTVSGLLLAAAYLKRALL
jgi:ADP-ribose pyrophosphatase